MMRYIEKREFKTIGLAIRSGTGKEISSGIIIGFIMISVVFFIHLLFGEFSVSFSNINAGFLLVNLFIYILIFGIQSSGEEIFFRGYLFQTFIEGTSKFIAVAVMSLCFGLIHFFNPNSSHILNILSISLIGLEGHILS